MKRGNSAGSAGDKSLPITVDFAPTQGPFLPVVYSRLCIYYSGWANMAEC